MYDQNVSTDLILMNVLQAFIMLQCCLIMLSSCRDKFRANINSFIFILQ